MKNTIINLLEIHFPKKFYFGITQELITIIIKNVFPIDLINLKVLYFIYIVICNLKI